jgi:maltose O-acetyltransferase
MIRKIVQWLFRLTIWVVYRAYQVEGLNALLLILPAKMIPSLLRQHGAVVGADVEIHSPLIIHNASPVSGKHYANLRIGDECYLGRDVFLDLKAPIVMENCVTVSMRVTLLTHTDVGRGPLSQKIQPTTAPITMRQGAYIGANATVLQGVEIGSEAVVGAGSLVRHDVPEKGIVVGVPAHAIAGKDIYG